MVVHDRGAFNTFHTWHVVVAKSSDFIILWQTCPLAAALHRPTTDVFRNQTLMILSILADSQYVLEKQAWFSLVLVAFTFLTYYIKQSDRYFAKRGLRPPWPPTPAKWNECNQFRAKTKTFPVKLRGTISKSRQKVTKANHKTSVGFSLILMLQYCFPAPRENQMFGVDRSSLWFLTTIPKKNKRNEYVAWKGEIRPTHHPGWQSDEYHLWPNRA